MRKITPPFLFLFCIVIMVAIRNLVVIMEIVPNPFNYFGAVLIVLGIMLTIVVRKRFEKEDTEIHTFKNPRKLVTDGLFKISRNPIYLGFAISLFGVWILLGTILPIIGCLLFITITNYHYIPFEERTMESTFGNDYKNYKSKVRRWV